MTKVITLSELVANIRCRRNGKTFLTNFVNQCEFRDAVIIPPDATNGDMFKTMFPNVSFGEFMDGIMILKDNECEFWHNWWNAPYKGSEE